MGTVVENNTAEANDVCEPLLDNQQLLGFDENKISWSELVLPLQRVSEPVEYGSAFDDLKASRLQDSDRKVMVCHDMAGNYRGDKYVSGSTKWDDYRFYHWSGIDHFIYFSHSYITIPPVGWINAGHLNGVKVFGTMIVEGKTLIEEVLSSADYMKSIVAALVRITKACKFDGWLLNIEVPMNPNKIPLLLEMVSELTTKIHDEIPGGMVFWYDSVTKDGLLLWQNELNNLNEDFFSRSDGILINYGWNHHHLERTVRKINEKYPKRLKDVFMGIDIFSRSQIAGMETYKIVGQIAKSGMSTLLFAPGWTYEGLPNREFMSNPEGVDQINYNFLTREETFWTPIWPYLRMRGPTKLPFITYFNIGSGKCYWMDGDLMSSKPWFNLMQQDFQLSAPNCNLRYYFNDAFTGGSCLKIYRIVSFNRLLVSNFTSDCGFIVCCISKRLHTNIDIELILKMRRTNYPELPFYVSCRPILLTSDNIQFTPLDGDNLKRIVTGLRGRGEDIPSVKTTRTNWDIRCYEVLMPDYQSCDIMDVGMSTVVYNHSLYSDHLNLSLFLGGIGIYRGLST